MTTTDTSPEAIAALLDGVTPGPWAYNAHREVGPLHTEDDQAFGMICNVVCEVNFDADHPGNARFIAAAHELVPTLAAERDALRAEIARLTAAVHDLESTVTETEARAQDAIAQVRAERDAALIRAERSERAERAAHDAANTAIRQRDEARAQVAMAYEVAAKFVQSHDQSGVNCNWRGMADTVRALTPPDATAALAARDAAMRNEGRRQAAAACDWGDIYGDNAVSAILATLEPEGGE